MDRKFLPFTLGHCCQHPPAGLGIPLPESKTASSSARENIKIVDVLDIDDEEVWVVKIGGRKTVMMSETDLHDAGIILDHEM